MKPSARLLVTSATLIILLLMAATASAQDAQAAAEPPQGRGAAAGNLEDLKALLADESVGRIHLTSDVKLAEPLTIGRSVVISGQKLGGGESARISGDIVAASAGIQLTYLRLDGKLTLQNVHRIGTEELQSNQVSRQDITFRFDGFRPIGFFANGDYWVQGPVTITAITPDFDGKANGWEVNPVVDGGQGFNGNGREFDASLVPDLPYRAEGTISIVKTTAATGRGHSIIKSAVVLTVVEEVPPEHGAAVFRPPYVGKDKPYYRVGDLQTDLLPKLKPVENMPSLAAVAERYSTLQMDHKRGVLGRSMRPRDQMRDYQPKNTADQSNAALRLMMDDEIEAKMPALIQFVQFGIDKIHMAYIGQTWPDGGGHQPGHRLAPAFAAVMLDMDKAKQHLREMEMHGSRYFVIGTNTGGLVLWGNMSNDKSYWTYIMRTKGNRSQADPYGYIDGGRTSEGAYQVITAQSHKGEVLATHLMPSLQQAWHPTEWEMMQNYTDRWVMHGQWALPDPYAPFDGNEENYGKTFGPDPDRPGQAIAGVGRFPERHGAVRDGGQYRSEYVAAMWDAYRASGEEAQKTPPFAAIIAPYNAARIVGQTKVQATAFGIHGVRSVQFKANGADIGKAITEGPYEIEWDTSDLPQGDYKLTALAIDGKGNSFESAAVTVTVGPRGQ